MDELLNSNLNPHKEPKYYYIVSEFVTTFKKDAGKNEPISHDEFFEDTDLKTARIKANLYFEERLDKVEKGEVKYFLPFAGPKEFTFGQNAAYSIVIYLVQHYTDSQIYFFPVRGEDEDSMEDGLKMEEIIFKQYK